MAKRRLKEPDDYSDGLTNELDRFKCHMSRLHKIMDKTQKALQDVTQFKIFPLESAIIETIKILSENSQHPAAIVILGTARARLINYLLGENILPLPPKSTNCWRWLRLKYGLKRQIRLSLGTEFEIVDPDLPLNTNWNQIPSQNLKRNDTSDLSTVMDIELCNQFLKSGIQILVPPDLGDFALDNRLYEYSSERIIHNYESFYSKWNMLLENVFPIVLYAMNELDTSNNNGSKENLYKIISNGDKQNEKQKDFYSKKEVKNSIFYTDYEKESVDSKELNGLPFDMSDLENSLKHNKTSEGDDSINNSFHSNYNDTPKLSDESLLDLRQIFELHPNSKVLFVLFHEKLNVTFNRKSPKNQNYVKENLKHSPISESPDSSYIFDNLSLSSTSNSMYPDSNNSYDNYDPSSSNTTSSSNSTEMLNNKSDISEFDLLQRQKIFLTKVIQQLESLSNPMMKKPIISRGIIVNDTDPQNTSLFSTNEDMKKYIKSTNKFDNVNIAFYRNDFSKHLTKFSKICLQSYILENCDKLSDIHNTLLQQFILSSYDMARIMQIVPIKIQYVAQKEQDLYDALHKKFNGEKRDELLSIMQGVLQDMKNSINCIDWTSGYYCHNSAECINMNSSNAIFYTNNTYDADNTSQCDEETLDLSDYDVLDASQVERRHVDDVIEADETLPQTNHDDVTSNGFTSASTSTFSRDGPSGYSGRNSYYTRKKSTMSFKQASLEVQRTVLAKLSRNISIQLVSFVDCLRNSYFGTLQRCIDTLEEGRGKRSASEAIRQIILVTKTIDLQHCASYSFIHALAEHLRRFFNRLSLSPNNNNSCCIQSSRWRRQIALDTIESLSPSRLERIISSQLKEKMRIYHEQFQTSLESLSEHHSARLQQTEEMKLAVRKYHAPRFARLCLESTSLKDYVRYGLPHLGKEIGRGQYGVVFLVKGSWANYEPCAVKSVIPPDDPHFNELAMEFFNTRNIPPHDRILPMWGSVIDYSYMNGQPSVLLIFERLKWDLHCALLHGIEFTRRMQIAIDIVEGIRYLHAQGLVHRDIKLKNVLLDENNRAKLTDLGFCIPEAMMSGSIVGTPVHMAPELLNGYYDNSVDVYAFGILFWYLCSGNVRLPAAFERLQNKEQLWTNVKRGLRPERLSDFTDTCWSLMEKCWSAEPAHRPHLGDVQPILESIRDNPSTTE